LGRLHRPGRRSQICASTQEDDRRRPSRAQPSGPAKGRPPVIPGAFTYHRPSSVAEAVGLLADLGEDARPLAGGHSLIPMMKLRLPPPPPLVDLAGLKDLKGVATDGGDIVIGAMTTQHELIGNETLTAKV